MKPTPNEVLIEKVVKPSVLVTASIVNPFFGLAATAVVGIAEIADDYRKRRIREIDQNVGSSILIDLIKKDDKSRDVLHKILKEAVDENIIEKRMMLYAYIRNFHNGVHPEYDYHSKIVAVISQITFDELKVLYLFNENFRSIIDELIANVEGKNPPTYYPDRGLTISELKKSEIFKKFHETKLENILNRLSSGYDLIISRFGRMNGTFYGPLTDFGTIFLDYISTEEKV